MKKALVSTTLGAEGLPVQSGRELLLADRPQDFADAVCELLASQSRRNQLAEKAFELVQRRFDSKAVARQFEGICNRTVVQAAHR